MNENSLWKKKKDVEKFSSIHDYLENHIFKVKDSLFEFQEIEKEKRKEWNKATARVYLQKQKLDKAYEDLVYFRK